MESDTPNVLLLVVDSLRVNNVSAYSYDEPTTPYLDEWSREAITYTNARAPGTWSLSSHASMFTGYHVHEHRLTSRNRRLSSGHTIWEELGSLGYNTGVFTTNVLISEPTYGLQQGFDTVENTYRSIAYPFETAVTPNEYQSGGSLRGQFGYVSFCLQSHQSIRSFINGLWQKWSAVDSPTWLRLPGRTARNQSMDIAESFLQWEKQQDGPWAVCLNFMDVHTPYAPVEEYDRWGTEFVHDLQNSLDNDRWEFYAGRRPWSERAALEALYDGCIRQVDATIEWLVSRLRSRDEYEDTLVVVTSDHGQGFGEISRARPDFRTANHRLGAHSVLLWVPLFLKPPRTCPDRGGSRHDGLASLTNFPRVVRAALRNETIADAFVDSKIYAGADLDDAIDFYLNRFESIQPYLGEMDLERLAGNVHVLFEKDGGVVRKYVTWGEFEATIDVHDTNNVTRVRSTVPDAVKDEFEALTDRGVAVTAAEEVSADTESRLKSLGYM